MAKFFYVLSKYLFSGTIFTLLIILLVYLSGGFLFSTALLFTIIVLLIILSIITFLSYKKQKNTSGYKDKGSKNYYKKILFVTKSILLGSCLYYTILISVSLSNSQIYTSVDTINRAGLNSELNNNLTGPAIAALVLSIFIMFLSTYVLKGSKDWLNKGQNKKIAKTVPFVWYGVVLFVVVAVIYTIVALMIFVACFQSPECQKGITF